MAVKKICVVGAGSMGRQIAMCAALAGYTVDCTDNNQEILEQADDFAKTYFLERVSKGKMTQKQVDEAIALLRFTKSLEEGTVDTDFVIEAVIEKLQVKRSLFADLDRLAPPHAILATNSSYIVSSKIADVTKRPDKVCNMHFFILPEVFMLTAVLKNPDISYLEFPEEAIIVSDY